MNKYIEWDLEKFKAGWPAEWQAETAKFLMHATEADEDCRLVFLSRGRVWAMSETGRSVTQVLHLLARELDPHPDNKDGLYKDQIGDGWRIKGHGETASPHDQTWLAGRWLKGRAVGARTYRTRDPLPAEPLFKVGDRVKRRTDGCVGVVNRVEEKGDCPVVVYFPGGPVVSYYAQDGSCVHDCEKAITKLTTRTVPLGPEDIVLGKTVVRTCEGQPEILVIGRDEAGIGDAPMRLSWETLRTRYEISFDHGSTWQKAEKEVEDPA
jgi:hypothetical protein